MPPKRAREEDPNQPSNKECPIIIEDQDPMPPKGSKPSMHGQLVLAIQSKGGALIRLPQELEEHILEGKELIDFLKEV